MAYNHGRKERKWRIWKESEERILRVLLTAEAVTMVWGYIEELVFNMLVLVGEVKMADRVVRGMMGL